MIIIIAHNPIILIMLPISFLKRYQVFSVISCLLIGLFGMIYFPVLLESNFNPQIDNDKRASLIWAFFFVFIVTFLSSVLYVIGRMKKVGGFVFAFNVIVIAATFVLLILAVISSALPNNIMKNTCKEDMTSAQQWSINLENISALANLTFCQQICPCYIDPEIWDSFPPETQSLLQQQLPKMSTTNTNYPSQFSGCLIYSILTQQQKQSAEYLSELETQFQCSGWCSQQPIYMFIPLSEKTNQLPNRSCQSALVEYYKAWGKKCATAAWILFLIMLVNSVMVFCKVFHPSRKQGSLYQKLT